MSPGSVTAILGGLAIVGQLVNVYLNLRLRNALLEMREQIMKDVEATYVRKDVYDALRHEAGLYRTS
jgi:hypothetical protein